MRPIGGYFGAEQCLKEKGSDNIPFYFNSGRSAFAYLLKEHSIKHVFLPRYNCDVILEPLKALGISFSYYHITKDLSPEISGINVKDGEAIVVNNFFGVLDSRLEKFNDQSNILFDNSQAFYSELAGEFGAFNSFRKFFGLADGGTTNKALNGNFQAFSSNAANKHLSGRINDGPQAHYQAYLDFEKQLKFNEILRISDHSAETFSRLDHETIKQRRLQNFERLHNVLSYNNHLDLDLNGSIPMIYPYLIEGGSDLKKYLIDREIFVTTYWPNDEIIPEEGSFERQLMKDLVVLPIDQRYGEEEMSTILAHIEAYGKR